MLFAGLGRFVLLLVVSLTEGTDEEKRLYELLFNNYHSEIRPVSHPSHALHVEVQMELLQIKNLDEKNQVLETVTILEAHWYDSYLRWNSSEFSDLSELVVIPKRVWLPDFGIENSANNFYHTSYFNDFRVSLHETGRVVWSFGGSISTACELDMQFFPFDYQVCSIKIENWAYTKRAVTLKNAASHVHLDKYQNNGVWELLETHVTTDDVYYEIYPGLAYPEVTFELVLKRKSLYYVVNLLLPCFFIVSMALLVFWLPPDSGEKVSLGVTALLAFSVFQLVINENTPANSDKTPILSTFVTFTMGMSALSVFSSIFVLHLHHKGNRRPVPRWIKLLAFKVLANVMCMRSVITAQRQLKLRRSASNIDNLGETSEDGTKKNTGGLKTLGQLKIEAIGFRAPLKSDANVKYASKNEQELLLHLRYITKYIHTKEVESKVKEEWEMVAQVLDRMLFFVCFSVTFAVSVWLLMQRGDKPLPQV